MNSSSSNSFHLNVRNRWPGFRWRGLELRPDGALQLCSLPVLDGDLPDQFPATGAPSGPAGIAVDSFGNVYFSVPSEDKVLRIDACDGSLAAFPCVGGSGDAPTQFRSPRGLLVPKHRAALFVADSGNHRVQIFDLSTSQLLGIWGEASGPTPGTEPGQFDTPWTLASDNDGNVYIVDYGNHRVQKFDATGQIVPSFAENIRRAQPDLHPADIAIATEQDRVSIFILDDVNRVVVVFDPEGNALVARDNGTGTTLSVKLDAVSRPLGLAVAGPKVFIGDNGAQRIVQFQRTRSHDPRHPDECEYEVAGDAIGYSGLVTALALDQKGGLLAHSGTTARPLRLSLNKGYGKSGFFWSDAISAGAAKVQWHSVHAQAESQSNEARLRLYVSAGQKPDSEPSVDESARNPFADVKWRPRLGPPDPFLNIDEVFIWKPAASSNSVREEPTPYLWVGGFLSGDGTVTPVVSQLRVEFNHPSYLEHLPAIYRPPHGRGTSGGDVTMAGAASLALDSQVSSASKRNFLLRFLSLFEGTFGEVEDEIGALAKLFDVAAVPRQYLPWLATWFALELDEVWKEPLQREAIAQAFAQAGRRGTAEGLRGSLRAFVGIDAVIEEPVLNAAWWVLPGSETAGGNCECSPSTARGASAAGDGDSVLGFTTMLAAAPPQGAVVGASATLDGSHLISGEDYGVPLFEEVAHQVSVFVYRGQLRCEHTEATVRSVIEREKPAHVAYQLCVVEPRMRIGFQARVGVDAVIAGIVLPGQLNEDFALDTNSALGPHAEQPKQSWGRVGFLKVAS